MLPRYLNPECDRRWRYFSSDQTGPGVLPTGNDIAISLTPILLSSPLDSSALVEVGPTPYIEKTLQFLQSHEASALAEQMYRNLCHCLHCGAPYKPHTMTCSACKTDFLKLAFKNPETTVDHLNYVKIPDLSMLEREMPHSSSSKQKQNLRGKDLSFDQLWSDPEVRKILSHNRNLRLKRTLLASRPCKASLRSLLSPRNRSLLHPDALSCMKNYAVYFLRSTVNARRLKRPFRNRQKRHQLISPDTFGRTRNLRGCCAIRTASPVHQAELLDAVKKLKPRKKSELSKRGVVRVIYHATMIKNSVRYVHIWTAWLWIRMIRRPTFSVLRCFPAVPVGANIFSKRKNLANGLRSHSSFRRKNY